MPKRKIVKPCLYCLPSGATREDWSIDKAYRKGVLDEYSPIPSTWDMRRHWPKTNHQGRTSSCVGWATADLMHWHFSGAKRIDRRTQLSARYLWMTAKERDEFRKQPTCFLETEGTSIKAALRIARKFGVLTEGAFPFEFKRLPKKDAVDLYALAGKLRIRNFYNLSRKRDRSASWRRWLALQGPILARVLPDATWHSAHLRKGQLTEYKSSIPEPHAVLIVGYDFSMRPGHFIIRNSEGSRWGHGGHGYASIGYVQQAIDEAYGVVVESRH